MGDRPEKAAENGDGFREWCLIELMGRHRLAGLVSEQVIGGQSFIRIDVPAIESAGLAGFTKFFGPGAIYAMTPTTEEMARATLVALRPAPVSRYEFPMLPAREPALWEDDDGR